MKKIVFVFLIPFLFHYSKGQDVNFGAGIGYGIYQLEEMKEFQIRLRDNLYPFNVNCLEQFPDYIFYTFNADYQLKKNNSIGLDFCYYYTGARNQSKDYSGEYLLDMYLSGYRTGICFKENIISDDLISIYAVAEIGSLYSVLITEESVNIYNTLMYSKKTDFRSLGAFFEPSFSCSYRLLKNLRIGFKAGYELDISNKLHLKGNRNQIISSFTSANWAGFKFSIGVSFSPKLFIKKQ
jgi:hypothetical protein